MNAAAIIFFAYIGFDSVSTGAEEAANPSRDLPLAIIGSLVICTVIYIIVSIAAVGPSTPRPCRSRTHRSPLRSMTVPASAGGRAWSRSARWWRSRACC